MKIDIVDLNRFIQVNECPKVDNPVFFNSSRQPTTNGVCSYELFGISGSYNRKTVFGYVDLKRSFLHPVVYKMLVPMDKKIANIVDGSRHFRLVHGELVEDQEGGLDKSSLPLLQRLYYCCLVLLPKHVIDKVKEIYQIPGNVDNLQKQYKATKQQYESKPRRRWRRPKNK